MGLIRKLMDLGIKAEEVVEQVGIRAGSVPIQWEAGADPESLIHRLPRDPRERANRLAKAQNIIVNEGENALVLRDGKAEGALEPGFYGFDRQRFIANLDVIWMKTGQRDVKWGIGNITSQDGIQVSANGMLYVRVVEPMAFNNEVLQGALIFPMVEFQRFLMPRIQGVLRSTISQWAALDLQSQRDAFSQAITSNLGRIFGEMGIEIVDLEVIEIGLPAEFKAAIAQTTLNQHTGNAAVVAATHEAQIAQIEAMAEANRMLAEGSAQAQVFAQLQAQGIDPMKLKMLDALQTMAETPSEGGALISGDVAKAQLFGSLAANTLTGGAAVPGVAPPQPPAQLPAAPPQAPGTAPQPGVAQPAPAAAGPAPAEQPAPAAAPAATPAGGGASAEDIAALEKSMDGLVERLAAGEISEDLFNKLSARIEAKLAAAKGG
ncbi:MAG: SPFH domain-containing protein [Myxococcales bacterium]|nr:SPFH domain-containing protein [Myxococcales bacterium]